MGLDEAIAKKKAAEQQKAGKQQTAGEERRGIKHNEVADAKVAKFKAENPTVVARYKEYTKDELIDKHMLIMAEANERRFNYSAETREYLEKNPDMQQEVQRRLDKMPEAQRARAYQSTADRVIAQYSRRQATPVAAAPAYSGPALKP